jgi:toxin ParE1/3/4
MSRIRWTEQAAVDVESIARFLAEDSPQAADGFVDRVDQAVGQLAKLPQSGRVVPELDSHGIRRYREIVISPWRVFYEPQADSVTILAVIDGRRNVLDILLERLTRSNP